MSIPSNWRTRQQRYSLRAEVFNECGNTIFPPRDVCPYCAEQKQTWTNLSGRGEVYSYTTMYSAPTAFEEYTPYTVALVKLAEGPLITAQLFGIKKILPSVFSLDPKSKPSSVVACRYHSPSQPCRFSASFRLCCTSEHRFAKAVSPL